MTETIKFDPGEMKGLQTSTWSQKYFQFGCLFKCRPEYSFVARIHLHFNMSLRSVSHLVGLPRNGLNISCGFTYQTFTLLYVRSLGVLKIY